MAEYTIDGKRVRKVYNEKRITMTAKTPDGKTVTTKSTGVDAKGLHYVTPSDSARLDFKASGKVKFGLSQALPIDYANADVKGKTDLLTKEVSDDVINKKAARNRAAYQQKQAQKEKEKREKSKRKTRKKLTSIKGAGGGTSNEDGVIDIRPGPRLVKKRGGAVMKSRGGTFKGTF